MFFQDKHACSPWLCMSAAVVALAFCLMAGCGAKIDQAAPISQQAQDEQRLLTGRHSPLDALDPANIPAEERRQGQPEELVAVLAPSAKGERDYRFRVAAIAFHPSGQWLVGSHGGDEAGRWTRVWEVPTCRQTEETMFHDNRFGSLAFAPDGKTVAFGHAALHVIILADFKDGKLTESPTKMHMPDMPKLPNMVRSLVFAPDGKTLATSSGGFDKMVRLWEVREGALRLKTSLELPSFVLAVAVAPDGQTVAAACHDKTVHFVDVTANPPKDRATLTHASAVESVAVAPDGRTLAAGCADKTLWLWDLGLDPIQVRAKLEGHVAAVGTVQFSPDGTLLVSTDRSACVIIWTAAGKKHREWPTAGRAVFAPDSRHVATQGYANSVNVVRLAAPSP